MKPATLAEIPTDRLRPPAPALAGELMRPRVQRLLDARWDHTVTTVVAGAGFGKTIALGQALRANLVHPRGIEAWVSARVGCEDPERFAESVRLAFAGPGVRGGPRRRLQSLGEALAPIDAVLLLDDVDALVDAPATLALIDDLVRTAPTNFHVVLCGRAVPPLALARLRAAGQVAEVGEDDLRFTDDEVAQCARTLGHDGPVADLGGWPALVRLSLATRGGTRGGAVTEFLWEEVVRALPEPDRRALFALTLLGVASADEVAAVCGHHIDVADFCRRVPLVQPDGGHPDALVVAHDLWRRELDRWLLPTEVAALTRAAIEVVAERGDVIASGTFALRVGAPDALRRAALGLVRSSIACLPVEVARAWLQPGGDGSAEMDLLRATVVHAENVSAPGAGELDAIIDRFVAGDDVEGASVALGFAARVAEANNDLGRLVALAIRARTLPGTDADPLLRVLLVGVDAAVRFIGGDAAGALAVLEGAGDLEWRPDAILHMHWHLLLLAGRAADAAHLAREDPHAPLGRELAAVAHWFDGDPRDLTDGAMDRGNRYETLSERDRFDQAAFVAVMASSAGDPGPVDEAVAVLASSPIPATSPPHAALVAVAHAHARVVDHDDEGARDAIDRFLDDHERTPTVDAHLRRALAVPYVCSPRLRAAWDEADLGPSQHLARAVGRVMLGARSGRPVLAGAPPFAACAALLPLPWSVELAARAAPSRLDWAIGLFDELVARFGAAASRELARCAAGTSGARVGAGALIRAMPVAPAEPVRVEVIGPVVVRRGGHVVAAPELRRARVRQLLALLVVERVTSRDRAMDLLWPDLDVDKARSNLRVTLTHLQRLLEPDRPRGAPPYFLRADAHCLRLVAVPHLHVDLWEVERDLTAADEASQAGDTDTRLRHLAAAVERWRGRPLVDLDAVGEVDDVGGHVELRLVDAAVTVGELELTRGSVEPAARRAERALVAHPYDERAHRLLLAAHLQAPDHAAARTAMARLGAALAELGSAPEAATRMLLRRAEAQLGPVRT